ncbi:MAG: hypothetical protein SGILL_001145 [Bacillariaceae sp.]
MTTTMSSSTAMETDSAAKRKQPEISSATVGVAAAAAEEEDPEASEAPAKKLKIEAIVAAEAPKPQAPPVENPAAPTTTTVTVSEVKTVVKTQPETEAAAAPKAPPAKAEKTCVAAAPKTEESTDKAETKDVAKVPTRKSSRRNSNGKREVNGAADTLNTDILSGNVIDHYIKLPPLVSRPKPLKPLGDSEVKELEKLFGIDKGTQQWDDDWAGVVAMTEEEVANPDARPGERQKPRSLLTWAAKGKKSMKLLNNLVRQVYSHRTTPKQAKKILASANPDSFESLRDAIGRLSLDPLVLRQDGWTTIKAAQPDGASGGAFRIGEKVIWQGYTAVVFAFVHDPHIGDLWKAMWIEDFKTFDVELEELVDAKKRWDRKQQSKLKDKEKSKDVDSRRSNRNLSNPDFQIEGIEHGIILATSYAKGARHGVFWPARVMHATELVGSQSKRQNRLKVDVVFLAPYWNSDPLAVGRRTEALSDSIERHGDALFSSGPLFEVESIDANEETIQQYPYSAESGLDTDELKSSFKFAGLPKAVFARFLDSHRLALALRTYSQDEMKSTAASDIDRASAGLLEGHPLSALTTHFPHEVLHLPFEYILSQLPHPEQNISSISRHAFNINEEPALKLAGILDAMKPPASLGLDESASSSAVAESPRGSFMNGTPVSFEPMANGNRDDPYDINRFLTGLTSLQSFLAGNSIASTLLKSNLSALLRTSPSSAIQQLQNPSKMQKIASSVYQAWVVVKAQGEELVGPTKHEGTMKEWRRFCERIYKYLCTGNKLENRELGQSLVITDSRCNLHLTSSECYERPVRLPAAMKAVRQAKGNIRVVNSVEDKYIEMAEDKIISKAHKRSYIQRFKKRCAAATQDVIISLTEDSEGNGGEDTKGTKGSWKAAVAAVGAALQAAGMCCLSVLCYASCEPVSLSLKLRYQRCPDMIMAGECVNAFCPTRPPGHHAGRELHAMKAVSNGFCVLNAVACAALYATTPLSEGGLGLSRVCVIDIDVHHGNGTQDVLCSTYDPRFLYVSIHAGGPHVNGIDLGEVGEQMGHHLGRNLKGIFPGRCGDTSPHQGVLNIPLGPKVTSHALGTALITKVSPTVEKFAPDLIIVSAGFDAHKNDPLNLGGLNAEDFGTLTEIICKLAFKSCSGRVLSVMEGGYGVPCCRPQHFQPPEDLPKSEETKATETAVLPQQPSAPSHVEASVRGKNKRKPTR